MVNISPTLLHLWFIPDAPSSKVHYDTDWNYKEFLHVGWYAGSSSLLMLMLNSRIDSSDILAGLLLVLLLRLCGVVVSVSARSLICLWYSRGSPWISDGTGAPISRFRNNPCSQWYRNSNGGLKYRWSVLITIAFVLVTLVPYLSSHTSYIYGSPYTNRKRYYTLWIKRWLKLVNRVLIVSHDPFDHIR